ncbi:MAG: APC family permease [Candidatus Methanoperedens sp.]|nr:APC family permease [Candidatus Methanoperedens sp.]MCZ7370818.1 APC family permease [Candidatus Methanoperedens sp.]
MEGKKSYKKSLGLYELVSLGVGGTIGSGIFVVPGIAAGIAGPSSLFAWFFVAISASCVMFSLAWASSRYPSTGAFYSIFSKVFGTKTSTSLVILYLISSVFGIATIASGIGQYLSYFGIQNILIIEMLIIAMFCLINIIGVYLSGTTEIILTTIKTIPLVILAVLLMQYIQKSNFSPFYPAAPTDFLKALIIVYWPFTGFEISAIPAEETKDKNLIFKSLIIVMSIVVSVYLLLNISLIGSVGSRVLASSPAPLATAAGLIQKESGWIVGIIGIAAMLSALNAYVLGTSRVMQNISHRFRFPILKDIGDRGTPVAAILLSAFFGGGLLLFSNHFNELASISVITTLLPYIFLCLSAYMLFIETKIRLIAGIGAVTTIAILVLYFIF